MAALLSKSVAATLPLAIAAVVWWTHGTVRRDHLAALAPFVVLGAASGLATAWLEVAHVGAAGADWSLSPPERLLVAGRVPWFYAWKVVWPHPLIFIYPRWALDASSAAQWAFPLATVALGALLWVRRARWSRGPFTLFLFFLVTLIPVLGFLNVYPMRYAFVADHFQYVASIAVLIALCAAGRHFLRRVGPAAPALALAVAALACTALARAETTKYGSAEALWRDTIRKHPGSWIAHNNLGILQLSEGRLDEARASFERAISARPDLAEGHNNLGTVQFRLGDTEGAAASHRRAAALDPGYAEAHNNLAVALSAGGRHDEAIASLERALALDPDYPTAHYNLANALAGRGRYADAETHYEAALQRAPSMAMARYRLGLVLVELGRADEAIASFEAAFRLNPSFGEGLYQAGNALLRIERAGEAETYYRRAIAAQPGWAEAHCNLGTALLRRDRLAEAAAEYRRALALKPGYALAERNLAICMERLKAQAARERTAR